MCGRVPDQALGWPAGTVRAILALIIVPLITTASVCLMILFYTVGKYTEALGILSGLTGFTGSVVGYYFGTKSAEKASSEIIRAHNQEIEFRNRFIQVNQMPQIPQLTEMTEI